MVQMNQRIKSLWVEKLRSGEYEQGRHQLKSGNKFCCLGVLCNIYLKENGKEWDIEENGWSGFLLLPPDVRIWAGLPDINPEVSCSFVNGPENRKLSSLNDTGASFLQIANWIEASL